MALPMGGDGSLSPTLQLLPTLLRMLLPLLATLPTLAFWLSTLR